MRPQTRPVIVEFKRKRGTQERRPSIWGDVDLSRAVAEVKAEAGEQQNDRPVDSGVPQSDVGEVNKVEGEQYMADPQEADTAQVDVQTPANAEAAKVKTKAPRVKKAKAAPKSRATKSTAKAAAADTDRAPVRGKRKIYSEKERAQKLAQIKKLIAGDASVKNAVKEAGISEQTYYQWLRARAPAGESDELKDLVALEEENKALKKRLAEQLRKENAELKRKLGLAK